MIRRQHRKIAIALLLLNVSGARAITVSDPCDNGRVFFSASLGFKAITKTVLHQDWKKDSSQHALGERTKRFTANDMATIRRAVSLGAVDVQRATSVTLSSAAPRIAQLYASISLHGASPGQQTHPQINV